MYLYQSNQWTGLSLNPALHYAEWTWQITGDGIESRGSLLKIRYKRASIYSVATESMEEKLTREKEGDDWQNGDLRRQEEMGFKAQDVE